MGFFVTFKKLLYTIEATGWACNGRNATTYDERLKLEYYYAENASLVLDIKCIFRTIKAVLFKTGAK